MSFSGIILTNSGSTEIAKAEMGERFSITDIVLGEGTYSGEKVNIDELVMPVMTIPITKITRNGDEVHLEVEFSSKDAPKAFYFREIGIIVNDKLCYYDNCGNEAEYIDPEADNLIKQKRMRIVLLVSAEIEINVTINSTLYALEIDFLNHVNNKNNPHDVDAGQIGLGNVDNTADIDKPVSKDQQAAIDAAYANSNYYTDEKIAELINGAPTTMDTLKEIADAMAENEDVVDALNEAIGTKANENEFNSHVTNRDNPHDVDAEQVGLGNVPNVATNDQTPTYTSASTLTALTSGEKLSIAFGKIAKAVSTLISHIAASATASALGHVKLSDSNAVTDSTGLALPATEKNANISGTLAYQLVNKAGLKNGNYSVTMQADGNLVIYNTVEGTSIWDSKNVKNVAAWAQQAVNGYIEVVSCVLPSTTITAGGIKDISTGFTVPTGYTALGVVQYNMNSQYVIPYVLTPTKVHVYNRNTASSVTVTPTIYILVRKNL